MRVAAPTSTSSRPVANGSSVPGVADPLLLAGLLAQPPPHAGDDVVRGHAGGLRVEQHAARRPWAPRRSFSCAPTSRAHALGQLVDRQLGREAGRLAMAAAAELAGDARHVDAAVGRAQRHLAPARAVGRQQVADEHGDRGVLDGAQVVDDALGVGLERVRLGEVVAGQVGQRDRAVVEALDPRRARGRAAGRARTGSPSYRRRWISAGDDARLDQLGRHVVRLGRRVVEHELAGVGDQPDVERLGDRLGQLGAELLAELEDDLGRARRVRRPPG